MNLLTPEEFEALPDGTRLRCISGEYKTKGIDYIDQDTRAGLIAWGVSEEPKTGVLAESEWIASE